MIRGGGSAVLGPLLAGLHACEGPVLSGLGAVGLMLRQLGTDARQGGSNAGRTRRKPRAVSDAALPLEAQRQGAWAGAAGAIDQPVGAAALLANDLAARNAPTRTMQLIGAISLCDCRPSLTLHSAVPLRLAWARVQPRPHDCRAAAAAGDPRTGVADDTTQPLGSGVCVQPVYLNEETNVQWYRYTLDGDKLNQCHRDGRLSDHAKNLMYILRAKAPARCARAPPLALPSSDAVAGWTRGVRLPPQPPP
jgi:hypothetical protein